MEATHVVVIVLIAIATGFLVTFERSSRKNSAGNEGGPAAGGPAPKV